MMGTTIRLAEIDGTTLLTLRTSDGSSAYVNDGVALTSYSLGSPIIRESVQDMPLRSGSYDLTTLFGARTFTAELKVFNTTSRTRHETADFIRGLCAPARRVYAFIQQDGWAQERRIMLRGQPQASTIASQAQIYVDLACSWNCPAGVYESATDIATDVLPVQTGTGMHFAFSFPFSFTPGGEMSGEISITNAGTVPAYPSLRIYGFCTNPTVHNNTTGKRFQLQGITIPSGQYLDINVGARTVYMSGNPALSYYNKINWSASDWWALEPGVNDISMTATTQNISSKLTVVYRSSWI